MCCDVRARISVTVTMRVCDSLRCVCATVSTVWHISWEVALGTRISRNAIQKQTPRAVFACEKFRSKTDPLEQNLAHNLSTVLIPGWPYTHVSVPGAFLNLPDAEKRCLDLICSWDCTLGQINPTVSRPYERYEGPAHSSTRYFGVWG